MNKGLLAFIGGAPQVPVFPTGNPTAVQSSTQPQGPFVTGGSVPSTMFTEGTTRHGVKIITHEPTYHDRANHGDVAVFKRDTERGTVGVRQFINGEWMVLYNINEARKKVAKEMAKQAPAPTPSQLVITSSPMMRTPQGVMVYTGTTDSSVTDHSAEHGAVGIVKRDSGTVGVKQCIRGAWQVLYNEDEARKKFVASGSTPMINPYAEVVCSLCGETVPFHDVTIDRDGDFICGDCKNDL